MRRILSLAPAVILAVAAPALAQSLPRPLSEIRVDIDAVDGALLDLLNRRANLSLEVARAKAGSGDPVFRPGRQAALLRALAARNDGPMPDAAVWRVWREIVAASIHLQKPLTVAETGPRDVAVPLALGYFGGAQPMVRAGSFAALRTMLEAGEADVGVIPLAVPGEAEPWWRVLALDTEVGGRLRVVVRLPFLPPANGHETATAFVLAPFEADPSGDDRVLLALEIRGATPVSAALADLATAGYPDARLLAQAPVPQGQALLVEARQPVRPIRADEGVLHRLVPLGRYAAALGAE